MQCLLSWLNFLPHTLRTRSKLTQARKSAVEVSLDRTFPDYFNMPFGTSKLVLRDLVTCNICVEFGIPEFPI